MPRVVLLLPSATYRAADFLDAARRLGAEVVVASDVSQTLAHTMGDRAITVAMDDPAAAASELVALARRSPVDAVVAVDDQGVVTAAEASLRLGLRHNPPAAVAATRDKAALRQALVDTGVAQPRFALCGPGDDAGAVARAVGFPCVVKPRTLSGSRGVIRADDPDAARAAAVRTREIARCAGAEPVLLIEAYVDGPEVAVEGLLRRGVLEVLAVFDKPDPLEGPYFEETIYVTPSRLPARRQDDLVTAVAVATTALGLVEGPVHAELRLPPGGGAPVLLEVAARSIGGLCARVLRFGAGISLEEVILRHALGLPSGALVRGDAAAGVMMIPIPRSGVLRGVEGLDDARAVPGVSGVEISVPRGRRVDALPEGDRYLGFVFASAGTPGEVEAALRDAHGRLEISID